VVHEVWFRIRRFMETFCSYSEDLQTNARTRGPEHSWQVGEGRGGMCDNHLWRSKGEDKRPKDVWREAASSLYADQPITTRLFTTLWLLDSERPSLLHLPSQRFSARSTPIISWLTHYLFLSLAAKVVSMLRALEPEACFTNT
jgi:hypothetical protein